MGAVGGGELLQCSVQQITALPTTSVQPADTGHKGLMPGVTAPLCACAMRNMTYNTLCSSPSR